MSFNKITIVGNLGKEPELNYTPQGNAVCKFTVATTEKKQGESVTTWFRVTLWGKQAENASKYLTKGKSVYIEGRLRLDEWADRDGKIRFTLDVTATDMQFIGGQSDGESFRERETSQSRQETQETKNLVPERGQKYTDDDIPF